MIARDTIAYKRRTSSVKLSMPDAPIQTRTDLGRVVHLRVCERLVMSFIPTRTSEQSNSFSNWLLDVDAEAVLHSTLLPMGLYVGCSIHAGQEPINCFAVAAHVCVIRIGEQSDHAQLIAKELVSNLELSILATGARQVPIKINAIRHLWHKAFTKTQSPVAILILDQSANRVPASIRRVVKCAVVIHSPVHEL